MSDAGAARFARYAHPPSALGYCGPPGEPLAADASTGAVTRAAPRFEGAWPYLEVIARTAGLDDPLDERVVEAYWLGGGLGDAVAPAVLGPWLRDRFAGRLGVPWAQVEEAIAVGGRPTHAFHVFGASPWVALLARGVVDEPVRVLDGCRIGWGEVVAADEVSVTVVVEPLRFDGDRLVRGGPTERVYRVRPGAVGDPPSAGDAVTVHWDRLCERVDPGAVDQLRAATDEQLELVDRRLRVLRRA